MKWKKDGLWGGVLLLTVSSCCTMADCDSIAVFDLSRLAATDREKGFWEKKTDGQVYVEPLSGRNLLVIPVRESPVRFLLPTDTLTVELRFHRETCNQCFPGFGKKYFPALSGFVFQGKEIPGDTLVITR